MNIDEKLDQHFNKVVRKLTVNEKKVLKSYTANGVLQLNKYLLNKDGLTSYDIMYGQYLEDNLSSAINKSLTPFDLTLYHGTTSLFKDNNGKLYYNGEILQSGDIFTSSTFLSTSINKEIAENFMNGNTRVLLEINIEQGEPALWLKPLSLIKKEQEILLLNNSSYIVNDIIEKKDYYHVLVKSFL